MLTVGSVVTALAQHYPPETAQDWDAVGLVCGDPNAPARAALLSVDVTAAVVAEARELGAELIIAHHPLLLRAVNTVAATHPKGRLIQELLTSGIALYCAHTNADIGPDSTVVALAEAIGLTDSIPLDQQAPHQRDKLITFVPETHIAQLVDALATAGAGAIGHYDRCYFATTGTGSFRPLAGATPYLGEPGRISEVTESRVEMIMPRAARAAVITALRNAHPYEEPAFDVIELAPEPSGWGLGRVGQLVAATPLRQFAERITAALPQTATGVRVAGDPARMISKVAVTAGAGDSHLDAARQAGVDVYVTSDLRHHPASEALEWAEAPALIDISHWAAESLWLERAAAVITKSHPDLVIKSSTVSTDPWTFRID